MKISTDGYTAVGVIVILILAILLLVGGPLAIIWSLNTLFPVVAIPYTFWHWLAVVVLSATWFGKYKFPSKA